MYCFYSNIKSKQWKEVNCRDLPKRDSCVTYKWPSKENQRRKEEKGLKEGRQQGRYSNIHPAVTIKTQFSSSLDGYKRKEDIRQWKGLHPNSTKMYKEDVTPLSNHRKIYAKGKPIGSSIRRIISTCTNRHHITCQYSVDTKSSIGGEIYCWNFR